VQNDVELGEHAGDCKSARDEQRDVYFRLHAFCRYRGRQTDLALPLIIRSAAPHRHGCTDRCTGHDDQIL
jgi:hypothetical protein